MQQVASRLSTNLAYTTVMTTLDRLFKKGLLRRKKCDRAFIYSTALTPREVEGQRAANLIRRFFADSAERPELLLSCLVDAVEEYDTAMLDQLEARIQAARARQLASTTDPPSPQQPSRSKTKRRLLMVISYSMRMICVALVALGLILTAAELILWIAAKLIFRLFAPLSSRLRERSLYLIQITPFLLAITPDLPRLRSWLCPQRDQLRLGSRWLAMPHACRSCFDMVSIDRLTRPADPGSHRYLRKRLRDPQLIHAPCLPSHTHHLPAVNHTTGRPGRPFASKDLHLDRPARGWWP